MPYVSASGANASNSAGAPLQVPARRRSLFNFGPLSSSSAAAGKSKHNGTAASPSPSPSASSSSSSSSEDEDDRNEPASPAEQPTTPTPSPAPAPALKLSLDAIPFPSLSTSGSGPPSPGVLPRTPSTPVILPNGKPLKPSLKSSLSAPHLPPASSAHLRSQSAPSTPNLPKNVHFPERGEDLQTVRLFRPAGRPAAVSFTGLLDNDTETETEGYDSSALQGAGGYPFPIVQETVVGLHPDLTSPVPAPSPPTYANVHLETLQLPRTRPYTLCGSVLVRNVAFSKSVAVRFTLDDWQTTSEVAAHYVTSLPALPPPFRAESHRSPLVGDALTALSHASVGWDRFSFQIRLDDVERKLAEKTLWCVVRYTAHGDGGGEWWDNNAGANYRVVFRKEVAPLPHASSSSQSSTSSSASKALAKEIRSSAGGLPPLQLRTKTRPTLTTSLSFGAQPKSSATVVPMGPVSPVKGLSLRNYVPPTSPKSPPPPVVKPLTPITTPTLTPTQAPPALGLGALDFNTTQQAQANSVAFPSTGVTGFPASFAGSGTGTVMGSPIGSPGTSASYEALVRQWCFGGGSSAAPSGHGKSASAPEWMGMGSGRLVGVGELA